MAVRTRRQSRGEHGQILVIVAGGMTALLIFVGLVIDGGNAFLNRRAAQNTSDLSALAGTRLISAGYARRSDSTFDECTYTGDTNPTSNHCSQAEIFRAIKASVEANDCSLTGAIPCSWQAYFVGINTASTGGGDCDHDRDGWCEDSDGHDGHGDDGHRGFGGGIATAGMTGNGSDLITAAATQNVTTVVDLAQVVETSSRIPAGTLGVRVLVQRLPGTFLARLAGVQRWNVNTDGTAITETSDKVPAGTLLPIAVRWDPNDPFQPGNIYQLTDGGNDTNSAPGQFSWLSWSGSTSASTLKASVCTPNNTALSLPDTIDGTPGASNASDVRTCLQSYTDGGEVVLVPLYTANPTSYRGTTTYSIERVGAFVLTSITSTTSNGSVAIGEIRGYFITTYQLLDPTPGGSDANPPNDGDVTTFVGLIR